MMLNHFDQNIASVDSFFGESNNLTGQYNPGFDQGVGFGYAQNTDGYEWGEEQSGGHRGGHQDHFDGGATVYSHGNNAGHGNGADPAALARANIEWEQRSAGMAPRAQAQDSEEAVEPLEITDYLYHIGPDALDFDPDTEASPSNSEFWKRRIPSVLINLGAIGVWMWLWSHFGFSAQLPGTAGTVVYWGFVALMIWGALQSDHRSARYEEEREQLTATETNLHLIIKVVAGAVALLLGFKLLDGKSGAVKQNVYMALGIAFFASLFGVMSMGSKKRGEVVRRNRKIKAAALNLSIGLIAVAAMLTFNVGTRLSGTQSGGAILIDEEPTRRVVTRVVETPGSSGRSKKGSKKPSYSSADVIEEIEFVREPTRIVKQVMVPGEVKYETISAANTPVASSNANQMMPQGANVAAYGNNTGYSSVTSPTVLQPQLPVRQPPYDAY